MSLELGLCPGENFDILEEYHFNVEAIYFIGWLKEQIRLHGPIPSLTATFVLKRSFCLFVCLAFGENWWRLLILLEKEKATHSIILAWRIPWTEELGGLQSTGHKESDTTERVHFHYQYFNVGIFRVLFFLLSLKMQVV